jgi:hypothetical protein
MALRRWFLEPDAKVRVTGKAGSDAEIFNFLAVGADTLSGWEPPNISMRVRCLLLPTATVELVIACDATELARVLVRDPSPWDWVDCVCICVSISSRYTTDSS